MMLSFSGTMLKIKITNYTEGAKAWADNLTLEEQERTKAFVLLDMVGDADLQLHNIQPGNDNPKRTHCNHGERPRNGGRSRGLPPVYPAKISCSILQQLAFSTTTCMLMRSTFQALTSWILSTGSRSLEPSDPIGTQWKTHLTK